MSCIIIFIISVPRMQILCIRPKRLGYRNILGAVWENLNFHVGRYSSKQADLSGSFTPWIFFFLCLSVPDTNAYRLDQILLYVNSYPKCVKLAFTLMQDNSKKIIANSWTITKSKLYIRFIHCWPIFILKLYFNVGLFKDSKCPRIVGISGCGIKQ